MRILIIFLFFVTSFAFTQETKFKKLTESEEKEYKKVDKKNILNLGSKNEKGEKLIINIQFLNSKTLKPITNRKVFFYQAAKDGNYYPKEKHKQETARISGYVTTNSSGKVLLNTILPGNYGTSEDIRHIHLKFLDANPKNYDIFFKQFSGEFVKKRVATNHTMYLLNLKKNSKNQFVGFLTIKIKNPN